MQIIIDIPDKAYKEVKRDMPENLNHTPYELIAKSIRNGTPLPKGKWKMHTVGNGYNIDWECSNCGFTMHTDFFDYRYCPKCGAEMESD